MIKRLLIIFFILASYGCVSCFKEEHYFSSPASSTDIPNYYRVKVEGSTYLTSSRYISGYFSEDLVNAYFNEYTQPTGGALQPSSRPTEPITKSDSQSPAAAADIKNKPAGEQNKQKTNTETGSAIGDQKPSGLQPLGETLTGKKLIMILSSNSEEIMNQIKALSSSKEFTASLSMLLAQDKYKAADSVVSRLYVEKSFSKTMSELAKQKASELDKDKEVDTAAILTALVNSLASNLGYQGFFIDLENAERWLHFSRAGLIKGDR